MLKLSIIIPIYNVEKYIRKCVESCLAQDLPKDEYEIIVVNDGTPDNSVCIVEDIISREFQKNGCCNIRIITRKNGGLSAARNTGFREAKGQYVWFVDSDDWIEPNVLKTLTSSAISAALDVLCFNLRFAYGDGNTKDNRIVHTNDDLFKGEDFLCKVAMPVMAWLAIYSREFLNKNNLQFLEGIIHEDQEFTPRAYCLAERIAFCDMAVYNYLQREGGIMKSKQNTRRCKDLLTVADSLYVFTRHHLKKGTIAYDKMMEKVSFAFTQSLAYYDSKEFPVKQYCKKEYYPLHISSSLSPKFRWKYRLVNFSIYLYLLVYKFLK